MSPRLRRHPSCAVRGVAVCVLFASRRRAARTHTEATHVSTTGRTGQSTWAPHAACITLLILVLSVKAPDLMAMIGDMSQPRPRSVREHAWMRECLIYHAISASGAREMSLGESARQFRFSRVMGSRVPPFRHVSFPFESLFLDRIPVIYEIERFRAFSATSRFDRKPRKFRESFFEIPTLANFEKNFAKLWLRARVRR